jgi:hypothetical protein
LLDNASDEDADSRHHLRNAERIAFHLSASGASECVAAGERRLLRKRAGSQSAQGLRERGTEVAARPAMLRDMLCLRRSCASGDVASQTFRKRTIVFQIF